MHKANLDVLRAFAVSCVVIHHLTLTLHFYTGFMPLHLLDYFRALGHAGVLAFFVHTSLVLMYSLERMHRAGGKFAIGFYIRRILRIYPLAIVAILIAFTFHFPWKTWDDLLGVALFLMIATVCAFAAFHLVESPLIAVGKKLGDHAFFRPSPESLSLEPAP